MSIDDKQTDFEDSSQESMDFSSVDGYKKRSQLRMIAARFAKNRMAMVGLVVLILLVVMVVTVDFFFDYQTDAIKQDMRNRLQSPSMAHWFGTDQYGRDIFARIVYGARISLVTSICVISISTVLGAVLGALSAYYGGWVDNLIMRINDVFYALPFNLMAICVVASLGSGIMNLGLACVVGVVPGFARIFRSAILPIKSQEYIEAAKACGTHDRRILMRHIIPNAMGPIIVQATLNLAITMLAISGLSYIGLGIESPMPEWGVMLSEGTTYMRDYPFLVLFPGFAIVVAALALNLIGDGMRDALDPKLKN
ncbi:MAG: ABC transporter permease [Lachnospiraceae bacterium]|jgi:peptide/nickel transport system permease protein|nr:ABC transporter permease [Lachnospiraceae bacterium]